MTIGKKKLSLKLSIKVLVPRQGEGGKGFKKREMKFTENFFFEGFAFRNIYEGGK